MKQLKNIILAIALIFAASHSSIAQTGAGRIFQGGAPPATKPDKFLAADLYRDTINKVTYKWKNGWYQTTDQLAGPQGVQGIQGVPGQSIKGDPGAPGSSATVTVGNTTTLPAGSAASVTNTGTASNAVLNFAIPQDRKAYQEPAEEEPEAS